MPYTELAHGVWYPEGGMYSVVETLMDLARQAGVELPSTAPWTGSRPMRPMPAAFCLRMDPLGADVVLERGFPDVYQHCFRRTGWQ